MGNRIPEKIVVLRSLQDLSADVLKKDYALIDNLKLTYPCFQNLLKKLTNDNFEIKQLDDIFSRPTELPKDIIWELPVAKSLFACFEEEHDFETLYKTLVCEERSERGERGYERYPKALDMNLVRIVDRKILQLYATVYMIRIRKKPASHILEENIPPKYSGLIEVIRRYEIENGFSHVK